MKSNRTSSFFLFLLSVSCINNAPVEAAIESTRSTRERRSRFPSRKGERSEDKVEKEKKWKKKKKKKKKRRKFFRFFFFVSSSSDLNSESQREQLNQIRRKEGRKEEDDFVSSLFLQPICSQTQFANIIQCSPSLVHYEITSSSTAWPGRP